MRVAKRYVVHLADGETLVGESCSGGGYGPAVERDPQLVARDVLERFITPERARDAYGVVVDLDGVVDEPATAALRAR